MNTWQLANWSVCIQEKLLFYRLLKTKVPISSRHISVKKHSIEMTLDVL